VCTPQSGYYEESYRKNIFLDDLDASAEVLRKLQFADESELLEMADRARAVVAEEYNWDKHTSLILRHLGL
jgi:hypothetical protein